MSVGKAKSLPQNQGDASTSGSSGTEGKSAARFTAQTTNHFKNRSEGTLSTQLIVVILFIVTIVVGIPKPEVEFVEPPSHIPPENVPRVPQLDVPVLEDPELHKYPGGECGDGYFSSPDMAFTQFCKYYAAQYPFPHFRGYRIYLGKYFVDDPTCYLIDNKEFSKGWSIRFALMDKFLHYIEYILDDLSYVEKLPYDSTRFRFISAKWYATDETCHTVPFNTLYNLTIPDYEYTLMENDFILGRSRVFSNSCSDHQWILGLYSEKLKLCFYTRRRTVPLIGLECQVLCDKYNLNHTGTFGIKRIRGNTSREPNYAVYSCQK